MEIKTLTVDISKNFQHVCAFDQRGKLLFKKVCKPATFHKLLSETPPCEVISEACGMAHHWARTAKSYGHNAKLIAPKFVKQFVTDYKNDFNDALAIYEAASRPRARFVAVKSPEQQEIAFIHRNRSRTVGDRTQLINQIRSLLAEFGLTAPKAKGALRKYVQELCDPDSSKLGVIMKREFLLMLDELDQKDKRIKDIDKNLMALASTMPMIAKLMKVPGIGPITATALVSEVGDFNIFRNGREFAAWLGLVPKQFTTGNKIRLGSITKAGNRYLRRLLINGARALIVLSRAKEVKLKAIQWMKALCQDHHSNVVIVAMANKLARTVWAIIVHDREYDPNFVPTPPAFLKEAA